MSRNQTHEVGKNSYSDREPALRNSVGKIFFPALNKKNDYHFKNQQEIRVNTDDLLMLFDSFPFPPSPEPYSMEIKPQIELNYSSIKERPRFLPKAETWVNSVRI